MKQMVIIPRPSCKAAGDGSHSFKLFPIAGMLHGGSHMSHTINLVGGLISAARNLQELGRHEAAINLLERLAAFRELPPAIAEEAHSRLADLHAQEEQFKQARRHLTIAITYRPQHAAYHHRMACWIEADPSAAIERA